MKSVRVSERRPVSPQGHTFLSTLRRDPVQPCIVPSNALPDYRPPIHLTVQFVVRPPTLPSTLSPEPFSILPCSHLSHCLVRRPRSRLTPRLICCPSSNLPTLTSIHPASHPFLHPMAGILVHPMPFVTWSVHKRVADSPFAFLPPFVSLSNSLCGLSSENSCRGNQRIFS